MNSNILRDNIKNTVREAADIVDVIGEYVTLKKAGTRFTGLCPFHNEKTPSFSVNPQGQFFYCFGCGESGDVFSFVMKHHHMDFPEAMKLLADKYKVDLPEREMSPEEKQRLREREGLYAVNEAAAELFRESLKKAEGAQGALRYLRERGVPDDFIDRYRLGFAPSAEDMGWSFLTDRLKKTFSGDVLAKTGLSIRKERGGFYDRFRSRIMFPIVDMTGRVVAFGGRVLGDGKPKYMNSPESPIFDKSRLLFGLHQHKEAIRKARTALVVEGNFDLLLLAVHGIDNVVAPLGTSLTRQHVHSLRGYCEEVVLLFDADAAGLQAAMRSIPFFLAEQLDCRIALLPQGQDPDSLVRAEGPEAITVQVESARPLAEFVFDTLVSRHGLTLNGKGKIISELLPIVQGAADATQRSLMVAHFSEKLGVPQARFQGGSAGTVKTKNKAPEAGRKIHLPRKEKQLVEFLILYPEHFEELDAAGMERIVEQPIALRVIETLRRLKQTGGSASEEMLSMLTDDGDRQYVADIIMKGGGINTEEGDGIVQGMRSEILHWLEKESELQEGDRLHLQIKEAERAGDTTLLLHLLQKKMESAQKRTGC